MTEKPSISWDGVTPFYPSQVRVEGVLPDLTPEEIKDLQQKPPLLLLPEAIASQEFPEHGGPLYVTWSTVQDKQDPWFEVVDENWKTVKKLESKAEFDSFYERALRS